MRTHRYTQVEVGRARYKDSISRRASESWTKVAELAEETKLEMKMVTN
jgi:hypothetical protein